jgi:CheY-like chemotaxis protein
VDYGNGKQVVLLVDDDDEVRSILRHGLERAGFRVVAAFDERDAVERAVHDRPGLILLEMGRVGGGGLRADLILVNLVRWTAEEVLAVGRRVREHAPYDGLTPLVVMPEKYGKEVEGTSVRVGDSDWVVYLGEEPGQLQDLLARLLGRGRE